MFRKRRLIAIVIAFFLISVYFISKTFLVKKNVDDFKVLESGMSFQRVVLRMGFPNELTGSGFAMPVYTLKDGSRMILNFGSDNRLYFAVLVKPDGTRHEMLHGGSY